MMNKLDVKRHGGTYEAPQCEALAIEVGSVVLDNGSSTLPTILISDEEDW